MPKKKSAAAREPAGSFVRIDTAVRDQLKKHCIARGLIMSSLVSSVLSEYLKHADSESVGKSRR